jgi:chromate reductase, NAD(P)H dehydrogenase (quinone)
MAAVLVGLSGSLRAASLNTALLRTAAEVAPAGVAVRIAELRDLPFYDADLEARGEPLAVTALRRQVADADGILLAFPEYNWSVPAVLKNAIDWLSRGPDSPLDGIPAGMLSAAGRSGGSRAQAHMLDILGHNAVRVATERLMVPRASQHVVDGRLVTPELRVQLRRVVESVLDQVGEQVERAS